MRPEVGVVKENENGPGERSLPDGPYKLLFDIFSEDLDFFWLICGLFATRVNKGLTRPVFFNATVDGDVSGTKDGLSDGLRNAETILTIFGDLTSSFAIFACDDVGLWMPSTYCCCWSCVGLLTLESDKLLRLMCDVTIPASVWFSPLLQKKKHIHNNYRFKQ